jgi:nucleotide-binding universal stress UspA family protein
VRLIRSASLLSLLLLVGCPYMNPPVVKQRTVSSAGGSTRVIAVMPFATRPGLVAVGSDAGMTADEVAELLANFMAEALAANGARVISPSDLATAFLSEQRPVARRDPPAAAELAASRFGATSVVMGEGLRWRERKGEAYGTNRPASVAYEMTLYQAPVPRRLWSARFDHTQRTLLADPLTARKYPGGGTRFLTAAELARWALGQSAASLMEGQWRAAQ